MENKGKGTILIIDSTMAERAWLRSALEEDGYVVVSPGDIHGALVSLGELQVDCAILGMESSEPSRRGVYETFRKELVSRALPIIVLVDRDNDSDKKLALRDGNADFVFRPILAEELLIRVRKRIEFSLLKKEIQIQHEGFQHEREQRSWVENALKLNEDRLDALLRLSEKKSQTEEELNHFVLDSCVRLTGSALGYLHYINKEENGFDSYVWSKGAAEACAAREYMDFSLASAGLWADCMRKRGPVTCNDYPALQEKKGLPEGHIPIQRIMSIPIMKDEKMVAVLGVANKSTLYDEADQRQLQLFGNRLWSIIEAKRTEIILAKANADLARLAKIDSLTGLANRRTLGEFLESNWALYSKKNESIACLMIDIDFFKLYNDNYGHQAGDEVLKKVADVITDELNNKGALAARYGGDEFVAVMPGMDLLTATRSGEAILNRWRALMVQHAYSGTNPYVTISIGLGTLIPSPDTQSDSLVRMADDALYAAKRNGRNCMRCTDEAK